MLHIFSAVLISFSLIVPSLAVPDTLHLRWNHFWPTIDAGGLDGHLQKFFAERCKQGLFLYGVATSEYQLMGARGLPYSQWAQWEPLTGMEPSQDACRGWEKRSEDIELIKNLGVRSYRFSVDWSRIEPAEGQFDEKALEHYVQLCKELRSNGIEPMVTLHHFVHPQWFEEKGSFEKVENLHHFINFARRVFKALCPYVSLWCTINEPGVYVLGGYIRGVFPPGKWVPAFGDTSWVLPKKMSRHNIGLAGVVLRNMLMVHVELYQQFHRLYAKSQSAYDKGMGVLPSGAREPQVGFAHQYLTFGQFHESLHPVGLVEKQFGAMITAWINRSILQFFETGAFPYLTYTGTSGVLYEDPRAPESFDYFGLNYYSHVFLDLCSKKPGPGYYDGDIRTGMPYGVYAEGLYLAIKDIARLGKPIYITENGVSLDPTDPAAFAQTNVNPHELWVRRYLFAVSVAIQEGCDVRGYYYWSLMDNFEWDMGYVKQFGLYEVDRTSNAMPRTLRPGAQLYQQMAKAALPVVQ